MMELPYGFAGAELIRCISLVEVFDAHEKRSVEPMTTMSRLREQSHDNGPTLSG